jgi:hypothetical protein
MSRSVSAGRKPEGVQDELLRTRQPPSLDTASLRLEPYSLVKARRRKSRGAAAKRASGRVGRVSRLRCEGEVSVVRKERKSRKNVQFPSYPHRSTVAHARGRSSSFMTDDTELDDPETAERTLAA